MRYRLEQKMALLASPVIALYGMAPFFLWGQMSLPLFWAGYLSLSGMIWLFWQWNIFLFRSPIQLTLRYSLSYGVTFGVHLLILFLMPRWPATGSNISFLVYPLLSTIAINTIILILLWAQQLQADKAKTETELQKTRMEHLEAQRKALMQQLQPHFLFNALSTLKSLISAEPQQAVHYTLTLSEFLRYTARASEQELVPLQEELHFTQDYLALQKTRFGDALQYHFDLPEHLYAYKLPVFALQSLVENALKHNALSKTRPLRIEVLSQDSQLEVRNPKQPKTILLPSGTGLKNLSNRYRLLSASDIVVDDQATYFSVKIPLLAP